MKCVSPITLKLKNPRNKDGKAIVPCGKCVPCLINRRESWVIRLVEEFKNSSALFVTLTYSDENLTYSRNFPTLVKRDVQLFFKRFRKAHKKAIKYYIVGEYGTRTLRPHYHAIIFGLSASDYNTLVDNWGLGNITVSELNIRRLVYTTKFHINKGSYPTGTVPPFSLMSKGIGLSYVDKMISYHNNDPGKVYYTLYNFKKPLPRYYKQKLYSRKSLLNVPEFDDKLYQEKNEFERLNPNRNFWRYKLDQQLEFSKKYKEKTTYSETL